MTAAPPFGPQPYPAYPAWTPPPPAPQPLPGFRFLADHCEHCFCSEPTDDWLSKFTDHEECCGCGSRRVKAS